MATTTKSRDTAASAFTLVCLITASVAFSQTSNTEDPGLQKLAVDYYARKYNVGAQEAQARIELQDRATGIEDSLLRILTSDYAGVWFDHQDAGRLKVGVTPGATARTREIQALLREYRVAEQTDLVAVRRPLVELDRIQEDVRNSLMDMIMRGHARTSQNAALNSVVVTALASLPADEERRISQFANAEGVAVQRWMVPSLLATTQACNTVYCDPPLRGARLVQTLSDRWCTAGFTARHKVNKTHRLMFTAGHCIFNVGMGADWYTQDADAGWRKIGPGYGYYFAGAPGQDAGVIYDEPGNGWPGAPLAAVIVLDSSMTVKNTEYPIRDDSTSSLGKLLCMTGGYTGTKCAIVVDLGADNVVEIDGTYYLLKNLGELETCHTYYGDSGGPIYKNNRAFGIHLIKFDDPSSSHCHSAYQGIRSAQDQLWVEILRAP